ncbi:MAG: DUF4175 family protein [Bacteroidota bacterium]|nr:DUF4175 family protein [Bacteroidota bacterium]
MSADIISENIPELRDRLINIIELKNTDLSESDSSLIIAAINQKAQQIKVFDFKTAVNYKSNVKYLKYLLFVSLIFTAIFVFFPSVITGSTERIVNYGKTYTAPSKVRLQLLGDSLSVRKGQDFRLSVSSVGELIPSEVFLHFAGKDIKMRSSENDNTEFYYDFRTLNNSIVFTFSGGDYSSRTYTLNVLNPPAILDFKLLVKAPAYTRVSDTLFTNVGDITVPAGSQVLWTFQTIDAEHLTFKHDSVRLATKRSENKYILNRRILRDFSYSIKVENRNFANESFINYKLTVVPDLFPQISVKEKVDSTIMSKRFFRGFVQDDYGVSVLKFKYRVNNSITNLKSGIYKEFPVPINQISQQQEFFYFFDFSSLQLPENSSVEYYFEVYDNDGVVGAKSTKSQVFSYVNPSFKEKINQADKLNNEAQQTVSQAMAKAREIQKSLKDFQKNSLENSVSDWQKKQFMKELSHKENELQKLLQKSKKQLKKAEELAKQNSQNKELQKKIEELQKLTDQILNDEIKKLMEEINKLAEKYDQKRLDEILKNQSENFKDLEKMLDRNMELLKRFKLEQNVNQVADELKKLSDEMKKLADETKQKQFSDEDLLQKQKEANDKYNTLKEKFEKAQKENSELQTPYKMDDFKKSFEDIDSEMDQSEQEMEQGKNRKASDSQNKSSQKMSKLSKSMKSMMQQNAMQQNAENMDNIKTILNNLISFSFKQESLNNKFNKLSINDPKYADYTEQQIQLQNEYDLISDSLYALSKRVFSLGAVVQRELGIIEDNLDLSVGNFKLQKTRPARIEQTKVMTSANNLALILSSVLEQMKNMQAMGSGQQKGNTKKGKQKPNFGGLQQSQEQLKKQLEQMLQQMKKGQNGQGKMPSNKQLAKMLAQQEIFRQKLAEMKSKHSLNQETNKLLNEISKLSKQNEKQLINKQITPELLKRQKLIQTRLLEAEEAENKRKTDPKRQSESAKDIDYPSPEDVFLEDRETNNIKENLNRNQMLLKPFYRKVYEQYNKKINQ